MAWGWMLRENGKDSTRWLRLRARRSRSGGQPALSRWPRPCTSSARFLHGPATAANRRRRDRDLLVDSPTGWRPAEDLHDLVPLLRPLLLFFAEERDRAAELADRNLASDRPLDPGGDPYHPGRVPRERRRRRGHARGRRARRWPSGPQIGDHWGLVRDPDRARPAAHPRRRHRGCGRGLRAARCTRSGSSAAPPTTSWSTCAWPTCGMRAGDFEGARRYAEAIAAHADPGDFGYGHGILGDVMRGAHRVLEEGDDATLARQPGQRRAASSTPWSSRSVWHSHAIAVGYAFLCSADVRAGDLDAARHPRG